MIDARLLGWTAGLFCGSALAASGAEIEAAFAKAQKNGATAVYHDRCSGDGTPSGGIVFEDNSAAAIAKIIGNLAAAAAIKDQDSGRCSAGLAPGQERYYEIYPDGTVKLK